MEFHGVDRNVRMYNVFSLLSCRPAVAGVVGVPARSAGVAQLPGPVAVVLAVQAHTGAVGGADVRTCVGLRGHQNKSARRFVKASGPGVRCDTLLVRRDDPSRSPKSPSRSRAYEN